MPPACNASFRCHLSNCFNLETHLMQRILLPLFALFLAFALPMHDAEAKRMGGGKSLGMQRQAPMKREAAPQQATPPQNAAAPAQAPKRNWMGPLAGLAAGIGIAALLSHFGMGAGVANFLMMALLALGAFMLVRWFLNRGKPVEQPMQYAGQGSNAPVHFEAPAPLAGGAAPTTAAVAPAVATAVTTLPPGFDAEAFVRHAKVNFIRMQTANDAGNLDDLREFTTPEMYAELKLDIDERQGKTQRTEVVVLNAEVLEAVEENQRQIVSVRFHGMLREDSDAATPFDEIWNLTKPMSGDHGWVVAGIQQNG
jgi:predicted lipid-binding transport protein (Tim44 family)